MTKQEFIENMKPYALLFNTNLEPEVSKLWFEIVGHLTVDEFKLAWGLFLKEYTERWFPLPGMVIAYHKETRTGYFDTEDGKKNRIFSVT